MVLADTTHVLLPPELIILRQRYQNIKLRISWNLWYAFPRGILDYRSSLQWREKWRQRSQMVKAKYSILELELTSPRDWSQYPTHMVAESTDISDTKTPDAKDSSQTASDRPDRPCLILMDPDGF